MRLLGGGKPECVHLRCGCVHLPGGEERILPGCPSPFLWISRIRTKQNVYDVAPTNQKVECDTSTMLDSCAHLRLAYAVVKACDFIKICHFCECKVLENASTDSALDTSNILTSR